MLTNLRSQIIFFSWWVLWGALHFWVLYSLGWSVQLSFTEAFTSTIILSVFSFSLSFTMRYYRPTDLKAFYLFLWAAILTVLWIVLTRVVIRNIGDIAFSRFYDVSLSLRFITGLLIMSTVISLLYVFFSQKSKDEQKKLLAETEKIARETELSALRDQLQPHFLFNTLNSIHALAGSSPEDARSMILKLSEFLRNNLKRDSKPMISLQEELDHLSLYLDIEKVRFGHRLNVDVSICEECREIRIPALILQPLIENAIKHGLYDTVGQVSITVDSRLESGSLFIEISNPFDPESPRSQKGTGFGLSSVARRLFLIYGRQDLLKTETLDSLFKVILQVPAT